MWQWRLTPNFTTKPRLWADFGACFGEFFLLFTVVSFNFCHPQNLEFSAYEQKCMIRVPSKTSLSQGIHTDPLVYGISLNYRYNIPLSLRKKEYTPQIYKLVLLRLD